MFLTGVLARLHPESGIIYKVLYIMAYLSIEFDGASRGIERHALSTKSSQNP